jgi:hypothetical protein
MRYIYWLESFFCWSCFNKVVQMGISVCGIECRRGCWLKASGHTLEAWA